MKLVVLYRPNSENGRAAESFSRDFKARQPQAVVEMVSLDTKEGSDMARLYDVTIYPAILVLRDDSQMVKMWQGETIPLISEVASYLGA